MRLYTKTGDNGQTSLKGGRVSKDDLRVEAYGTIDELNAFVGQAQAEAQRHGKLSDLAGLLTEIQHELFDCGSDLAFAKFNEDKMKVSAGMVDALEPWIDRFIAEAPELKRFVLPGGSALASSLHVCRTVCRRAERRVVTLASEYEINIEVQRYLNRLSDLFFAAARAVNARLGEADTEYVRSAEVFRSPRKE
ncbi:cob(I)yrinic acid a,c-diamide adenosyltransferase [Paenibacillus beijingensis]|uniref:Corrinoid adenosyltransferase n=1 Tax=Paenibacillus beijingensis TaxID=1126833 RepID=A0A0D5NFA9_9BACL|nr:cob(I)yrinic acid a,c-diamide adenosyltransferase [Paenibacillus beijingensis]AJY73637.1 ATP:cob(I)alamin adenosyltransferase [Paenibacillus beijingensis]